MTVNFSTADLALARRMESAEAATGFALARGAQSSRITAEFIAGGCALFAGVSSPATHALGIGMNGPVSTAEFDRMEEFFHSRRSPCLIDLCPMAHASVVDEVFRRGYKVIEFNNLMLKPLTDEEPLHELPDGLSIALVDDATRKDWFRCLIRGFTGATEAPPEMMNLLESLPSTGDSYYAHKDGAEAATAGMAMHEGVAHLFGDSTLPELRGQGIQTALIRHRANLARLAGCDYAMACVVPGSGSHRNYERSGFQLFYMRVNVMREV